MINQIRKELNELKDEEYKKFAKKLSPDTNKEILGVRLPKLRSLAKKIIKEYDWKEFISQANDDIFEETFLQGFVIGYSKIEITEKLKYIKKFLPKIDSWSITDSFCATLKIKEKDLEEVWHFLLPYIKSDKEYEVRFAVVMMIDNYIIDEYIDEVLNIMDNINHQGYYVKMAVAWCIAEMGAKFNDKIMNYLSNKNNLDEFTYNKALQKMRESYKINEDQKEILKRMKRQEDA